MQLPPTPPKRKDFKVKFFEKNGKYNWVDKNNRFVGFENGQCCCEDAGWEITSFDPLNTPFVKATQGYNVVLNRDTDLTRVERAIDSLYFVDVDPKHHEDSAIYDEGFAVIFTLKHSYTGTLYYLRLFNIHNGYYAHGFDSWKEEGWI